jgi:hypothetical protein
VALRRIWCSYVGRGWRVEPTGGGITPVASGLFKALNPSVLGRGTEGNSLIERGEGEESLWWFNFLLRQWRMEQRSEAVVLLGLFCSCCCCWLEVEEGNVGLAGPKGQWANKLAPKIMKKIDGLPLQFGLKYRTK